MCGRDLHQAKNKKHFQFKDGSIVHHGDEQEGNEIGDNETIGVVLDNCNPDLHYIVLVTNSYSGQAKLG